MENQLTPEDLQNLLQLLERVPLTGTREAVTLLKIVQKIELLLTNKKEKNDTDKPKHLPK